MNRTIRSGVTICTALALLLSSGCAMNNQPNTNNKPNRIQMRNNASSDNRLLQTRQPSNQTTASDAAVIELIRSDGKLYAPLRQLADTLEFNSNWESDTNKFQIGDNDVAYELKVDSREAVKGGEPLLLGSPVKTLNGTACVPVDEIHQLFGDAMNFKVEGNRLLIAPSEGQLDENMLDDTGIPDFADDPNDPNKDNNEVSGWINDSQQPIDVPAAVALKNINITAMITTARRYMGVRYVFGAKPYPRSKRFDCSSFTKYVYGKYGVILPRSSRQQATRGTAVSRTSLRKGDLVFFYVPGRFKSNKIVGHVGIYTGSGKMINALPKGGVQITNINKAYWKKTYLRARRVAR